MNGIDLAVRFSYITNKMRFCGPQEAEHEFLDYIENKGDEAKIKEILSRFEGLHPYMSVIAKKHNLEIFDEKVVEAYWIGNELLNSCTNEDFAQVINNLMERGLPKSIGQRISEQIPAGILPHHSANVMFVGVGKLTGSVPTTIQNMDNCRISIGKILNVSTPLIVKTDVLDFQDGKLILQKEQTKTAVFLPEMLGEIKEGDFVALHWGFACMKITEMQKENIEKYTKKTIDAINQRF